MKTEAQKLAKVLMKAENCTSRKKAQKQIKKAEKLHFLPS